MRFGTDERTNERTDRGGYRSPSAGTSCALKNKPDRRLDNINLKIKTSALKMFVNKIRSRHLNSIIRSSKTDDVST